MSYKIMQQLIEQLKFYAIEKLTSDTQNLLELYLIQKNVADSLSDAKTQYDLDSKATLQRIHGDLFKHMSEVGFLDYNEGFFREPTDINDDHVKLRKVQLNNTAIDYYVCYSRMTTADLKKLEQILKQIELNTLAKCSKSKLALELAKLYSTLDYIHPFNEGNSRTIRTFIALLAKKLNYRIHWEGIDRNDFYLARDILVLKQAVNEISDLKLKKQVESFNQGVRNLKLDSKYSLATIINKALVAIK